MGHSVLSLGLKTHLGVALNRIPNLSVQPDHEGTPKGTGLGTKCVIMASFSNAQWVVSLVGKEMDLSSQLLSHGPSVCQSVFEEGMMPNFHDDQFAGK